MSSLGISIELLNFRSSTTPWCNGNTAGFGPAIQGSSPCGVALKPLERFVSGAFCVSVAHHVARFQNTPTQTHITNKQGEAPKPEASTIFGSNVEKPV